MERNAAYLKNRFLTGMVPTSADFSDIIDTARCTVARSISSAMSDDGFIVVRPGYDFGVVGGRIGRSVLESDTTASVVNMLTYSADVFVSADFVVRGTAGVSGSASLADGVTLSLAETYASAWQTAGNRITIDSRGRMVKTSLVQTDLAFSVFTSVQESKALTIVHPSIASARSVTVHVSALTMKTTSNIGFRFATSTAISLSNNYATVVYGFTTRTGFTESRIPVHSTVIYVTAGSPVDLSVRLEPVPSARTARLSFTKSPHENNNLAVIGEGTLVESADATITGLSIYGWTTNGVGTTIEAVGSYQVIIN
jgi:hypothetical protein